MTTSAPASHEHLGGHAAAGAGPDDADVVGGRSWHIDVVGVSAQSWRALGRMERGAGVAASGLMSPPYVYPCEKPSRRYTMSRRTWLTLTSAAGTGGNQRLPVERNGAHVTARRAGALVRGRIVAAYAAVACSMLVAPSSGDGQQIGRVGPPHGVSATAARFAERVPSTRLATATARAAIDQSVTVASNSTGNTVQVVGVNQELTSVHWTPGCTGATSVITRCVGSGMITIPARSSRLATITFDVGTGASTGSFSVDELDNGTETITVTVNAPVPSVAVTPQTPTVTVPPGSSQTAPFTVQNTGTTSTTFSLSTSCGGNITCGTQPSPVTLAAGVQTTVNAPYTAGTAGTTGSIALTAQSGSVSANATESITSDHTYGVTVGPKSQGVGVALSSTQSTTFTVHNASDLQQTYALALTCTGATIDPNTCSLPAGSSVTIAGNTTANVVANYTTTSTAGLATVTLSASNSTASDQAILSVQAPADGSIIVPSNSTNNTIQVTAYNGELTAVTWTPGCSNVTGAITRCVGSASQTVPGHQSRIGTIYFDVGAGPGTASFDANVLDSNVPTTHVTITAPDYHVTVTPTQETYSAAHDPRLALVHHQERRR